MSVTTPVDFKISFRTSGSCFLTAKHKGDGSRLRWNDGSKNSIPTGTAPFGYTEWIMRNVSQGNFDKPSVKAFREWKAQSDV